MVVAVKWRTHLKAQPSVEQHISIALWHKACVCCALQHMQPPSVKNSYTKIAERESQLCGEVRLKKTKTFSYHDSTLKQVPQICPAHTWTKCLRVGGRTLAECSQGFCCAPTEDSSDFSHNWMQCLTCILSHKLSYPLSPDNLSATKCFIKMISALPSRSCLWITLL